MKNTTITLFVKPEDLTTLLRILKILSVLDIDNNYTFQPKDITFSQAMISNYIWLNIDIELYMKFIYKYRQLNKQLFFICIVAVTCICEKRIKIVNITTVKN